MKSASFRRRNLDGIAGPGRSMTFFSSMETLDDYSFKIIPWRRFTMHFGGRISGLDASRWKGGLFQASLSRETAMSVQGLANGVGAAKSCVLRLAKTFRLRRTVCNRSPKWDRRAYRRGSPKGDSPKRESNLTRSAKSRSRNSSLKELSNIFL